MILGIDPGLANTGWAILKDEETLICCGCLKTKIADNSTFRLNQIYEEVETLIKKLRIIIRIKIDIIDSNIATKNVE